MGVKVTEENDNGRREAIVSGNVTSRGHLERWKRLEYCSPFIIVGSEQQPVLGELLWKKIHSAKIMRGKSQVFPPQKGA